MLENSLKEEQSGNLALANTASDDATTSPKRWPVGVLLCALGLVICFLLSVAPLARIPDPVITLHLAPGSFLALAGSWLPRNLGAFNGNDSAYCEFFALISLAFVCYGLGAWLILRKTAPDRTRATRSLIWLGALVAGIIAIVTPAMLSHDILVYASYSRVLAIYHANPYFVPISAFPGDPFTAHNYWSHVVSAYGPVWMLVCGFFGVLLSPDANVYVVAFRVFALLVHLLNIWLVGRTLRTMGRSPRTVTLGMLLYAWNPLLLLESGLGGHNDGLMIAFILAGILLAARAEKRGELLRGRGYLPVVAVLTLAALVKFTALPILAAFLLLLACKALRPTAESAYELRHALRNWRPALLVLICSGLAGLLVTLLFYGPFWLGHGPHAILVSFQSPPSALYSENSFMRSLGEWQKYHPTLRGGLLALLSGRRFWDDLTLLGIAACLVWGVFRLWHRPTTRTFVCVGLLTMSLVLLITPWFYSWYITWLLGLGAVCLPARQNRLETALMALTLTFSFSALFTYLFNGNLFGSHYYLVSLFTTIPPSCAFLLTLVLWRPRDNHAIGDIQQ